MRERESESERETESEREREGWELLAYIQSLALLIQQAEQSYRSGQEEIDDRSVVVECDVQIVHSLLSTLHLYTHTHTAQHMHSLL